MGMRISTNVSALNAQRALSGTKAALDRSMSRLSSGARINKAADDAAGLALSENFKAQMRGLKQASRNAQDGISMIQTAEGSLGEIGNILIRLRELSVQAASDTIGDRERAMVDIEYAQMLEEIDRIAETAEFNGTPLLAGIGDLLEFQIGTKNSPDLDRLSFDAAASDATTQALGIDLTGAFDKITAQESLAMLDGAINYVSGLRANFGAMQSRMSTTVDNISVNLENIATANSRIRDTDIAEESSELARQNIMLQAGTSVLAQANQQPALALSLLKG
ncbi:MAG: flagellin [Bdellovibrionales bacterium RIFCSPHIGHO2_01_FULL_40_29]|nr:MAG: flagellin [Bdellovibrionales bacterium RIFCSPHIGHO2_01_FULL_40_29]OFZ35165.1 MAG: flagellin [Bdellovibrionales bacterium RIFCSPHIGHO2_02_FULL_40_15]